MRESTEVLVVDDEDSFRLVLGQELERLGYRVRTAGSGAEALRQIVESPPAVVLVDLQMPEMDGMDLIRRITANPEPPEILVVTGHPSISTAVAAMKAGALDYVTKPFELADLAAQIDRAAERGRLKRENEIFRAELAGREHDPDIVGRSPAIRKVLEIVSKVAGTDATTLVLGESGTGKELVARAVHKRSRRKEDPFIVVDCCSLQENLLENELFGHEEGAYTGATRLKHGLFEVADKGTIFMDEIGEVSLEIQAKLLRVLETGSFRRVGSTRSIQVDVRLIAATNRSLQRLVQDGKFREDLYYRLNLVTITIPALRERSEDVDLLVEHFLTTSRVPGASAKRITPEAMRLLRGFPWPGNVRELRNAVERALILSDGDLLDIGDFHLQPRKAIAELEPAAAQEAGEWVTLDELERRYVQNVLKAVDGHRRRAAEILGISERGLYRKLRGLDS